MGSRRAFNGFFCHDIELPSIKFICAQYLADFLLMKAIKFTPGVGRF